MDSMQILQLQTILLQLFSNKVYLNSLALHIRKHTKLHLSHRQGLFMQIDHFFIEAIAVPTAQSDLNASIP